MNAYHRPTLRSISGALHPVSVSLLAALTLGQTRLTPACAAQGNDDPSHAQLEPDPEILHRETWEKQPILLEYNTSFPFPPTSSLAPDSGSGIFSSLDLWFMVSPDWQLGLGTGAMATQQGGNYNLSAQARYYLPHALVSEPLGFPFSRFYFETRGSALFSGPWTTQPASTGPRFSLMPQIGFETRLGSGLFHLSTGLFLSPNGAQLDVQPIAGLGLGGGLSFEPVPSATYEAALKKLNVTAPPPAFVLSFGAGLPEGLGTTALLTQAEWGFGFFATGLNKTGPAEFNVGVLLRHYDKPQNFGGIGYIEGVSSFGNIPSLGVRWGYELRPTKWLSLSAALGPGLSGPLLPGDTAIRFIPMLATTVSFILPLKLAGDETAENSLSSQNQTPNLTP